MPETTNKTAMMQLMDRLQDSKKEIKEDANSHQQGAMKLIDAILKTIDTELLAVEKQALIDFHIECMKKGLEVDGSEWKELYLPKITDVATIHFNQTFNTK